ncbi:alpha/beta hydrolase family protein [Rhizobium rhizogenes]|uniref:alpha/beta hydrolase family protein n=1 Tax=Rhizobium rhizogenes TaxID=359 RepID=UPI00157329CE|nr:dienelactone hydrolase [Rhizobium rhizogenes]NTH21154.1 dienelactone hydrolase [Rhizobium rhizogenes]NTH34184.1 dienelactone hydrolase [Rhizobium rhizogenes]NTH47432.1 dienelactone hydrolase [Rhizobium rhizogenes]NTH60094.1 dienelactone hydrolase [Rhizobium rhizogenes]NTH91733.1 dienelactone hydrolase [Rhizobium rhizogenes]
MTMIRLRFFLAALFCLAAPLAHAAGFQLIEIPADGPLPALKGGIWYPCAQPAGDVTIGPFTMSVTKDCPIMGETLPLVVVSHGRIGSALGHRDTAETLADAGFVVVAISHPGDNSLDQSRTRDFSVFVERPADIRRVIDFVLGPWPNAGKIDARRIGMFGFSRGGYTGLVAIGANPHFGKRLRLCDGNSSVLCDQVHKGELPELAHDPRIKAAMIADPLSVFFTPDSFENVKIPVQLWGSERGGDGVTPESVVAISNQLPTKPEFHAVPNSQHFDFLPPCPAELAKSAPEICADRSGFDRAEFHRKFNAEVLAFFRKHLVDVQ